MLNVLRTSQALALGVTMLSTAAGAQTAQPELIGTWTAGGSGIVELVIAATPGGATATAFGACQPTPCAWGSRPLEVFAPNVNSKVGRVGIATYRTSFSETRLIASLVGAGALRVETLTQFTDGSGRSNYAHVVIMR